MTETVVNTNTLPEILFKLITTEKVRVKELDGMIQLTPIKESANKSKTKAGALSASSFMALRIDTRGFKFDREEANERR